MIDALISVPTAAAALLLVGSGAAKLRHPAPAAALVLRLLRLRLLRFLGRPVRERRRATTMVRGIGAVEIAVGTAVLITGARPAVALLSLVYFAFTAVVLVALRSDGTRTSCGCFGSADSPLGPAHLVLDVAACAAGLAAIARPPGAGVGLLDAGGAVAGTAVLQAVLLAALGYLAVTSLPALLAARRALVPARRARPQET